MKGVSFGDSSKALASAMWMESFFDSKQYSNLSRRVAATLLPDVDNVQGFDSVMTNLLNHTDATNQIDLIDIGQKLSDRQWVRYGYKHRNGGVSELPFVQKNTIEGDYRVAAWELDTVSHVLWYIWVKAKAASPKGQYLENIILENNRSGESFSADFTGATLTNGVFSNVSFQDANFTRAVLANVIILADVDLSGVTQFDRSDWTNTYWWKAQKISVQLCRYLQANYPSPKDANLPQGCQP